MDKGLQNMYENDFLKESFQGQRTDHPRMIPHQKAPHSAGDKLSYSKQTIGMATPQVTTHVYENEEVPEVFRVIEEVETEYSGDSHINNAVRMALGKVKEKLRN